MNKDKVLYKVEERGLIYIFFGEIPVIIFLSILSYFLLHSHNMSIFFLGILLIMFCIFSTIDLLTFNEIIIYKNRVVIKRFIFGNIIMDIKDIKYVAVGGSVTMSILIFVKKNSWLPSFKYSVGALKEFDMIEIRKIILNIQQGV